MPKNILKHLKASVGQLLFSMGLSQRVIGDRAVIVAFHTIGNEPGAGSIQVNSESFEAYCQFFAKYFDVISLSELVRREKARESIEKCLVITFDDGYLDNYEFAAPLLERYNLPATFFVTTDFIDSQTVPWWDKENDVQSEWMSWDNIRDLVKRGFSIGAHTKSHANLRYSSEAGAEDEIVGSKVILEEKLGIEIEHFAYPYGRASDISEIAREIVADAGFSSCVSCFGGLVANQDGPFHWKRMAINEWYLSPLHFGFELIRESRLAGESTGHIAPYDLDKSASPLVDFFAYYFYPDSAVGAKRVSELARFLSNRGFQVRVTAGRLGSEGSPDVALSARVHDVEVTRVAEFPSLFDWAWRLLKRVRLRAGRRPRNSEDQGSSHSAASDAALVNQDKVSGKTAAAVFRRHYYAMYGLLDGRKSWAFLAVFPIVYRRFFGRTQVVVSSGPPTSTHVIGLFSAWLNRAEYILDFRDPWVGNPHVTDESNSQVRKWFDQKLERMAVRRADVITVTSEGIRKLLDDRYSDIESKVLVMYNGFDGEIESLNTVSSTRMDMLYAGTLYLNRNPFPLLNALKELIQKPEIDRANVSFVLVGDCDEWNGQSLHDWVELNHLQDVVTIKGRVSSAEAERMASESTVLVNLAQGQPIQIPAKTFDYLASGKEMLLVAEEDSASAQVVRETDSGVILSPDDVLEAVVAQLGLLYQRLASGNVKQLEESPSRDKFRRESQMASLMEFRQQRQERSLP